MATIIGETISRVRNTIKAVKQEAFVTDRQIYSILIKYAKTYIRRQESINPFTKFSTLFRTIPCMELIEVNRIEACCSGASSDLPMKRTSLKIPGIMEASFGPLFRTVSSMDNSIEVFPTTPSTYTSMTKTTTFKFNKRKYYWFLNGFLYLPDIEWEAIMVDGIFEDDLTTFTCPDRPEGSGDPKCYLRQKQLTPIPDFLFSEIEAAALKELLVTIQIPQEPAVDDNINKLKN